MTQSSLSSTIRQNLEQSDSETNLSLEIYLFQCGQGDTILLRLGTSKWVLVDCNLPEGPIRAEFFTFIDSRNIRRIDLICLSHPHDDHYTGMLAIIRHFTSNGRTIGAFCHGGTEPKEVVTLLKRRNRPQSTIREYESLYTEIYKLIQKNAIRLIRADENTTTIEIAGPGGEIQLIPVGPKTTVAWEAVRKTIATGRIRADLNKLSVVLALVVRGTSHSFDALLAADTDSSGFRSAMDALASRLKVTRPLFDAVKVSHHGSLDSHTDSGVTNYRKTDRLAIAAISSGAFDVLPDRAVLTDFLSNGWTVLLTNKRVAKKRDFAVELSGKRSTTIQTRNIRLRWTVEGGLEWEPVEARIGQNDLVHYDTAKTRKA